MRRVMRAGSCGNDARRAVSLLELLIVITIIALLTGLFLPVLAMVRESGRRTVCDNNRRQLYLAMQTYRDLHRGYVPFPQATNRPSGWAIELLPFMEEMPLYNSINSKEPITSPGNIGWASLRPPLFVCPVVAPRESEIPGVPITYYVLVIDQTDRWRPLRQRTYEFRDAHVETHFPWCTSPELSYGDARYPRPHESTEAVFGF